MAFTGNENHSISLSDAIDFTRKYRESIAEGEFLGAYFGMAAISKILDQTDCVGIRIYNAINSQDENAYVVVGVSADEKDMTGGELAEFSFGCPPFCPGGSSLAGTD